MPLVEQEDKVLSTSDITTEHTEEQVNSEQLESSVIQQGIIVEFKVTRIEDKKAFGSFICDGKQYEAKVTNEVNDY